MSTVRISPGALTGRICPPPSKSDAHRAILCAAMAKGVSRLSPIALSNDIRATIGAVQALGAEATVSGDTLTVDGRGCFSKREAVIDCQESGSTLRFLIPIAASHGLQATFTGQGRLPQRPIGVYCDCLPPRGVAMQTGGGLPLSIKGSLTPGVFSIPGDSSSQFVSGLLFALPLLEGESEIRLSSPLESAGYVDMTIACMKRFGVTISPTTTGYRIPGNQHYRPQEYKVQADWSQAAFFLAAGALQAPVELLGLDPSSTQKDRLMVELLQQMGASVRWEGGMLCVSPAPLHALDIDASQIPDLVPILAVCACFAKGVSRIYGAKRLRIKESDRLQAIAEGLNAFGGKVQELEDGLVIEGVPTLHGGAAEGKNDHRIVMALSIAALRAQGDVLISDAQSIAKSYPNFFDDYNRMGGNAHVF